MAECKKCHRATTDCEACKGGRNRGLFGSTLTCSKCNSTGQVCSEHKAGWK